MDAAKARTPAVEANVQSAEAAVAGAQAALDAVLEGATAEDRALAEARVMSARAALAIARAQLGQTQVIAPFAGQVGGLSTASVSWRRRASRCCCWARRIVCTSRPPTCARPT